MGLLCRASPLLGCRCGVPLVRDSHLLSQYGAKALDRVLSTILNRTENKVPVPKSYDRREAVFFHGKNFTSSGFSALLLAGLVSGLGQLTKLREGAALLPEQLTGEQGNWPPCQAKGKTGMGQT